MLGILVAINYIGARQNKRWDLTANKQFSLSDQSRNVLAKLDAPLQVQVFAQEPQFQRYQDKLKEYEYASKQDLDRVHRSRQEADGRQAEQRPADSGTIVFNYKGRTERVTADTEQDITNAIIKVVSGQQRKVYFTQGHGEKDTTSSERDGYNAIAAALGRENYTVDKLVDRAARLGARRCVGRGRRRAAERFLPAGGRRAEEVSRQARQAAARARSAGQGRQPAAHQPDRARARLGHRGRQQRRRRRQRHGTADRHRRVGAGRRATYPAHPITQRFGMLTAFPLAREASPVSGGVNGHTAQPFIETSPRSWAETDLKSLMTSGEVSLDESKGDKKGPITIGVRRLGRGRRRATPPKPGDADAPKPETRVAVIGDSDFAANGTLGIQGNRDLFMNTIGWLSQQDNLISIRPKEADDRRITLTATQQSNIFWLSLLIIPGCIFGAGVVTWWRRER